MQPASYWSFLATQVDDEYGVDIDDEEVMPDKYFTIEQRNGRELYIDASFLLPLDEETRAIYDEMQQTINEKLDEGDTEEAFELMEQQRNLGRDYQERHKEVSYELDDTALATPVETALNELRNLRTLPNAFIEEPQINASAASGKMSAVAPLVRTHDPTGLFDAVARAVAADHDGVPSALAVESVDVTLGPTDVPRQKDDSFGPHDYTIYFQTSAPHEFWAHSDSLDEYREQIVEKNENLTMEDVESQETFPVHVHMKSGEHTDPIVEAVAARRLNDAVRSDQYEVTPTQIHLSDDSERVRGTVVTNLTTR